MTDYGDTSGGYSDQAIRDIVAQLQGVPQDAGPAPAPVGVMPAPEVTPTMTYSQPAAPGLPMNIVPQGAAPARAVPDDWTPPSPTLVPPTVSALGAMAAVPRPVAPAMGVVLGRR